MTNPEISSAEASPSYEIGEVTSRLFDAFSANTGAALNATRLYQIVYDTAYVSSDPHASRARMYLQLILNPNHNFNRRFSAQCAEQGMSFQVGTMYSFGDDKGAEADIFSAANAVPSLKHVLSNTRPRRVYRMFSATEYNPMIHNGRDFGSTYFFEWNAATEPPGLEILPRSSHIPPPQKPKRKPSGVIKAPKPTETSSRERIEHSPWRDEFKQVVRDAIAVVEEEGLLVDGDIPASSIRVLSTSPLIGTETNRKRLAQAGLISRAKLSIKASMTAPELVLANIFNPNQKLLGQKNAKQKAAVEIVKAEVAAVLDSDE